MQKRLLIFLAIFAMFLGLTRPLPAEEQRAGLHATTDWDLRPSFMFDTLCALNFLSGDKYYLEFYQSDYDRLFPRLRPKERAAFVNLKHRIKDQNGGIISAQLALYFSATDAESLDDMIRVVKDSTAMERNLKATSYYSDDGWKVYEESRGDLEAAFKALKRIDFEADWKKQVGPRVEKARLAIAQDLPKTTSFPRLNRSWARRLHPTK
jgi:hypothetical protein